MRLLNFMSAPRYNVIAGVVFLAPALSCSLGLMLVVFGLSLAKDLRAAQVNAKPPNIIFILADDLGYGDIGAYGQKHFRTPRLDQMAREGIRFTQYYAGSTVCAPSRSV